MAHEIEAEFVPEWEDEAGQCKNCTSFQTGESEDDDYCSESKSSTPANGHCNYFQSID